MIKLKPGQKLLLQDANQREMTILTDDMIKQMYQQTAQEEESGAYKIGKFKVPDKQKESNKVPPE
jgi:hypothetical protein